jgi:hypothetical protein
MRGNHENVLGRAGGQVRISQGPVALPAAATPVPFFEQCIADGVSQFRRIVAVILNRSKGRRELGLPSLAPPWCSLFLERPRCVRIIRQLADHPEYTAGLAVMIAVFKSTSR